MLNERIKIAIAVQQRQFLLDATRRDQGANAIAVLFPSHQVASGRVLWRRADRRIRVQPPQCFGLNRSRFR
jgi:hypothetical protein